MKLRLIARRYSEAFVSYAKETVGLERVIEEAQALKNIIKQGREFQLILESPALTTSEKFTFLDSALKNYFSQELILFLKLLIEKRRIDLLANILDYLIVNYSHAEELKALIKSAYPLNPDGAATLKKKLEAKFGSKLHFYLEADKRLLGGVQVTVGHTIIDASIRKRMDELRKNVFRIRMG